MYVCMYVCMYVYNHKLHFREFQLTDGRPITTHRHAVKFFCPPKDSPADSTIAGIKSAEKAIPLSSANNGR